MTKVFCYHDEAYQDEWHHEGCVCENCEVCGEPLRGRGICLNGIYNAVFVHNQCLRTFLEAEGCEQMTEIKKKVTQ